LDARPTKWWGWGWEDKVLRLEGRPALAAYLADRLKVDLSAPRPIASFDRFEVPPSRVSTQDLADVRAIVGEANLSTDDTARVTHATGKGYKDLVRLRTARVDYVPDLVVYPDEVESVPRLLEFAARHRYAVIPFGGGTSVVGGLDVHGQFAATIVIDLRRLSRVLAIDVESGLATVEAGIRGPSLEEALNDRGLTLGHFPQSWEFSTVGGWIAMRASGSHSNRYGSIEDLVVGVRLISPARVVEVPSLPKESHGPSLKELVLGSEGALGVITQATLRVQPLPAVRRFASRLFSTFPDGVAALRAMAREDALPDMAYLGDSEETKFAAAGAGIRPDADGIAGRRLAEGSLLLMGFEGTKERVTHRSRVALRHARANSTSLGSGPAERWSHERFELPYLRDSLLDHGILVDTVETAARWSELLSVYEQAKKALQEALWKDGNAGLVLCHVSHAYPDGASLYYTFLAPQREGREIEQWEAIKAAVTEAVLNAGAALSHHHGIGEDHAPYLSRVIGEDGIVVLRALKRELDPDGIMNPGTLVTGSA
jgi:alkyldihydroxyacetonephosphate synthase